MEKIIGFHVDMNVAQFRRDYLERHLQALAEWGYNTILWEVENNVRWETCPECVSPEAFEKEEFAEILALAETLGLRNIPLLQTLGHCEYVLKHPEYRHLAEIPDDIVQYCPTNEEVVPFLQRWIDEYLDLFGKVDVFHLGADETWWLGRCPRCSRFAEEHGKAALYVQHVKRLIDYVSSKGVTPAIWADMLLTHPEAVEMLPKETILFDWRYDIHRRKDMVVVWGRKNYKTEDIPKDVLPLFGRYMFPRGRGREEKADPFYTAAFLKDKGFRVVGCPSSSSAMDTVFAPATVEHVANTYYWAQASRDYDLEGCILTSWTVRLAPWELQTPVIRLLPRAMREPEKTLEAFFEAFVQETFGGAESYWAFRKACTLLSDKCLFSDARTLGFDKSCRKPAENHFDTILLELASGGGLRERLALDTEMLDRYASARTILERLHADVSKGKEVLEEWLLAAENLACRAKASLLLMRHFIARNSGTDAAHMGREAETLLEETNTLKERTLERYLARQKPTRAREITEWLFDGVCRKLEGIIRERKGGTE